MSKNNNHEVNPWFEPKLIKHTECFECGSSDSTIHFHHVVPFTMGGRNTIPLCVPCHAKVHNRKFVDHKELQRLGIERAKKEGKFTGRRAGTVEPPERFLSKEKNKKIIDMFRKKHNYDEISEIVKCSKTTIVKVVKIYEKYHDIVVDRKVKQLGVDVSIPDWMKTI